MDKINILWIEDNPIQGSFLVGDLLRRDSSLGGILSEGLKDYPIPAIIFDESLAGYEKYFSLQVLQHPIEIKDFITMCLQLEDAHGVSAFSELDGVLPEIIAFDYHFGPKITINQGDGAMSYNPKTKAIREFINPNFRFLNNIKFQPLFEGKEFLLEKSTSENYSQSDFLLEISKATSYSEIKDKDKADLIDDDFGLFSAIEIIRIFREHIIVAVPATYVKSRIEALSLHGKYFEWLNEYEYNVKFKRAQRGEKKWDSIIVDAAEALQKKIETHSKLGKITLDLFEVMNLASGQISQKESERILTIKTVYEKKQLPLDGLFINVVRTDRDEAIKVWVEKILKVAFDNSSSRTDLKLIDEAKKYAETLWEAFQSERFWDRINFSKLHKLIKDGKKATLSPSVKEKYDDYLEGRVNGFKLDTRGNNREGFTYKYINSIEINKFIDKPLPKYTFADKTTLSWTILFVILKIYKARMEYLKRHKSQDSILLTENEIVTFLFPLASTPDVMPIHGGDMTNLKKYLNQVFILKENASKPFDELVNADESFFNNSVKYLLRCYAESIGLNNSRYYPMWLKNPNHE